MQVVTVHRLDERSVGVIVTGGEGVIGEQIQSAAKPGPVTERKSVEARQSGGLELPDVQAGGVRPQQRLAWICGNRLTGERRVDVAAAQQVIATNKIVRYRKRCARFQGLLN